MTDLSKTIAPKSDQLNADDLIAGPRVIKITKVSLTTIAEQPVALSFEGDNGKPFLPCKSMRRVLVTVWGQDGTSFVGRSLRLYRDDKVTFGAVAVGGIRISHMSHIDKPQTMALTATKASRKPFTVQPLETEAVKQMTPLLAEDDPILMKAKEEAAKGTESYKKWWLANKHIHQALLPHKEMLKDIAAHAGEPTQAEALSALLTNPIDDKTPVTENT